MYTQFWSETLKGRDHSEDLGVDREDNIRIDLVEIGWEVWTGFIWLTIQTNGGLL
jgi:hypothetical protein